jgi:hypothetical protein
VVTIYVYTKFFWRPSKLHARTADRSAILQQHDETSDDDAASIAGAETTS